MNDQADINADLRDLSMIESDSADCVVAIHVFEHFYLWDVPKVLAEWRRILKPGGKMILELPCGNKVIEYMAWCHANRQDMLPFMSMHALYGDEKHEDPAMLHKWLWFVAPLRKVLEAAEMKAIEFCTARYHFQFRDMRVECVK